MSGLNNNEFRLHQFSVEVCDIIRQIPAGKVLTYGQIARLAGFSNYSRWVGKVLSHHPGTAAPEVHIRYRNERRKMKRVHPYPFYRRRRRICPGVAKY